MLLDLVTPLFELVLEVVLTELHLNHKYPFFGKVPSLPSVLLVVVRLQIVLAPLAQLVHINLNFALLVVETVVLVIVDHLMLDQINLSSVLLVVAQLDQIDDLRQENAAGRAFLKQVDHARIEITGVSALSC